MAQHVNATAFALRVVLFFARNHDEELTTVDIRDKFGVPVEQVVNRLSRSVRNGMLARESSGPGRGNCCTYSAGWRLLEMIGQGPQRLEVQVIEACMAHGNFTVTL
jgi:hypothetical protein